MSAKLPSIPLFICKLWKYICGCFPFLIYFRDTVSVARLPPSFICKLCKYMRVPHINIIYLTLGAHCILYVYCTSYNVVCWCLVYSLQGLSVDSVTSSPPLHMPFFISILLVSIPNIYIYLPTKEWNFNPDIKHLKFLMIQRFKLKMLPHINCLQSKRIEYILEWN